MDHVERKKHTPWVIGCGIAAGLAVLAVIAIGIGGYFLVKKSLPQTKEAVVAKLRTDYDRLKHDGKLSAEQQVVFGDLIARIEPPDTSISAVFPAMVLFQVNTEGDSKERAESLAAAKELYDLLKKNPKMGFREIRSFMEKYQGIQQDFVKLQPGASQKQNEAGQKK